MPDDKKEKPKRVDRFIYDETDTKHIFRLGAIGGVFGNTKENTTIMLKNLLIKNKK